MRGEESWSRGGAGYGNSEERLHGLILSHNSLLFRCSGHSAHEIPKVIIKLNYDSRGNSMEMNSQVSVLSGRERREREMRNPAETPRDVTTAERVDIEHVMKASCHCDSANCSEIGLVSPSDPSLLVCGRGTECRLHWSWGKSHGSIDFSLCF